MEAASYFIAIIAVIRAKPLLQFQSTMSGHGLMLGISLANTKLLGGIANACGVVVVVVVVVVCPVVARPHSTIYSVPRVMNHELVACLIFESQRSVANWWRVQLNLWGT